MHKEINQTRKSDTMDIERVEKLLAIRQKMRDDMNAALDEAEKKIQQLQQEPNNDLEKAPEDFGQCYNAKGYSRMKSPHIRDRSFPIKISLTEELFLREESSKQQKSVTDLIREGYITKAKIVKSFERI